MAGSSLLAGAALFGAAVQAIEFVGPRATGLAAAILIDMPFPKPTEMPSPSIRAMKDLLRRQSESSSDDTFLVAPDNTCGYISGRPGAPYTCTLTDDLCVFLTSSAGLPGAIGCCNEVACDFHLDCLDLVEISTSSACDGGCLADTFTVKCTDPAAPFCNTLSVAGGTTDYRCSSLSISTAQLLSTTYDGETGRELSTLVLSDDSSSEPLSRPTITSPRTNTDPSATNTGGVVTTTQSSNNGGGGGSGTNAGAIAGGVVGGVAVIGLAALGVVFLMRRRNKPNDSPPIMPTQQMNQQPGPGGYGPPPPGGPSPVNGGHPHNSFYGGPPGADPKMAAMSAYTASTQPTPPPLSNGSPSNGYGQTQSQYFPPGQGPHPGVLMPGGQLPDRADATSPMSNYNRMSQMAPTSPSVADNATMFQGMSPPQQYGQIPPQHPGQHGPPQHPIQQGPPLGPVHEAGGNVVGGSNDNHHGQMHELA